MKNITIFILFALLLVSWFPHNTKAENQAPPVEVLIQKDHEMVFLDCWPSLQDNESDIQLWVYLNRPDGIAGYQCELDQEAIVIPLPKPSQSGIVY